MKTIGIIGMGTVGNAIAQCMCKVFEVVSYDPMKPCTHSSILEVANASDLVFICVPTDCAPDGCCDVRIVEDVLYELLDADFTNAVIIKSTIAIGTTDYVQGWSPELSIAFSPEFLTEKYAVEDFQGSDWAIVGGSQKAIDGLRECYRLALPDTPFHECDAKTAEALKYTLNCLLATKVEFCNEMADICEALGVEWKKVAGLAQMDDRCGDTHWQVPGPDGQRGFGGKCFPKDTKALLHMAHSKGLKPRVLEAVIAGNLERREDG